MHLYGLFVSEYGLTDKRQMLDWLVSNVPVHLFTSASVLTAALRERTRDSLLRARVLHVVFELQQTTNKVMSKETDDLTS